MPAPAKLAPDRPPMMRSPEFRAEMVAGTYAPHVKELNEFVDGIRDPGRGLWAPHIAPLHGGQDARLLFMLSAPGAGVDSARSGSGFLCSENDDDAAMRLTWNMERVGITPEISTGWNAYPWLLPGDVEPTIHQVREGVKPLLQVLELMPKLEVVLLLGKRAHDSWDRASEANPRVVRSITARRTYSTGSRAFLQKREERQAEQLEEFRRAAGVLGVRPPT